MSVLRTLLLAAAAAAAPVAVHAQATPPVPSSAPPPAEAQDETQDQAQDETSAAEGEQPAEEEETDVEAVTITGRPNGVRTSIDSISYSLADDLQAATGSLADALRNVPSVEVDPQGVVSLRGDANVTILIDGRPAAILSGEGRGAALLQMSADQFARIEVMTNPSAAYRPDGSGGVINLVSRPNTPRPGMTYSGSVRANIGGDGRYNLGASGSYTRDRLTLTGDFGLRHDLQLMRTDRVRETLDILSGQFRESRQSQAVDAESDSRYLRLAAEYRLSDITQLTVEARRQSFESLGDGVELLESDDIAGALIGSTERLGYGGFSGEFTGVTGRVLRRFGEGHEWSAEVRYDSGDQGYDQDGVTHFTLPAGPSFYEEISNRRDFSQWNLVAAYSRPLAEESKLRLGYEAEITSLDLNNAVLRGLSPATLAVDPSVTNLFIADQTVQAIYGTYERPFGALTAQFGLRLEHVAQDLEQVTSATRETNDYFRAYPTLHVEYGLSETQDLRASYSRRVQRPSPNDLNPFRTFVDPTNLRSGNAQLEPQVTDSWELAWIGRINQAFYQATLYYRDTSDAFTNVVVDLGGGIFLTRPDNLGSSRSAGLELVANGRLHATLRYNASLNLFRQTIDASNIGFSDVEGTTVTGRVNLNWQPTPEDFIQIGGFWMGESLFAQGRREPGGMVNLGYRRQLSERLAFQLTVRDVFDGFRDESLYETASFRDRTERRFGGRTAFIGLTYTFGQSQGRQQQQPAFDFSGGPQPGT